jgi:hypothetical protein
MVAGQVTFFVKLDPATEWRVENILLRAPDIAPPLMPDIPMSSPLNRIGSSNDNLLACWFYIPSTFRGISWQGRSS